jgi:hypothetical protein
MNKNKGIINSPINELFLFEDKKSFTEKFFFENPQLKREVNFRNKLFNHLKEIFDCLPKAEMEITEALELGYINFSQAEKLYEMFVKFFEIGGINSRLLLYIPFELIPDKKWKTSSTSLLEAIYKFYEVYLTTWKKLLCAQDIRSCFTYGDISENESEESIPKVVKAAHLSWVLVKKGLIYFEEIVSIIETSQDEILKESLGDSVKVMFDLNLIKDFNLIKNSQNKYLKKLAEELVSQKEIKQPQIPTTPTNLEELHNLIPKIRDKFTSLENGLKSAENEVSSGRIKWMRERGKEKIIYDFSIIISSSLLRNLVSINDFKKFIREYSQEESLIILAIETTGLFLEKRSKQYTSEALNTYSSLKSELEFFKSHKSPNVQIAIKRLELRLSYLGIIDKVSGIMPAERFSLQLAMDKDESIQLMEILEVIKADEQLSKMLFPVLLLYGSKVKGYGGQDFDLAIFIRPWVRINLRSIIQEKLLEVVENTPLQISFLDFWLEWEGAFLKIRDFKDSETIIGGNNFAHVLFESAWIGSTSDIKQIFNSLMFRFFTPDVKGITQAIKPLLLQEIERNILQFRLMHKGYSYIYPSQGGIKTRNSSAIDSDSSFWDSGYRQLATKLFISKVFL